MSESGKTKRQLIDEVESLHRQVLALEKKQISPGADSSSSSPEPFDHSYRFLLALSKAAAAIQTARTSQEVYEIVGRKIRHLGYHATIFLLSENELKVKVAYTTIEKPLFDQIEEITRIALKDYQFDIHPDSVYADILSENKTRFFDNVIIPIREACPHLSQKNYQKLATLVDLKTAIFSPLIIEQKTRGFLCVSGKDLCEANTVAVNIFANQVAITLETMQLSETLQFDELRYHALFDQAAESIVLIDPSSGEIVEFNHSAYANLGYSRAEFEKLHIPDFELNESPEEVKHHFQKVLSEGSDTFETRHRTKNGEIRYIQANISHIQIGEQDFIQGIWNDITDRVLADEQLAKYREHLEELIEQRTVELAVSEKRYRSLVENALVGVIQIGVAGKILYANPEMAGMLGFPSVKEMIGEDFCAFCKDSQHWQHLLQEMAPEKQIRNLEMDLVTKDGGIVNVLVNLTREDEVLSGMIKNITDQKQAEESYRESQRRLTTLMDNLPGMAYRCLNDADWTMEFVNQNSLKLTGYSPRELINNSRVSFVNLVHPDDRQMIRDAIQAAVKDKRPYQLAYRIQAAGGEKKWVWEQGEAVYDEHGNVLALEGFITDVTDQKNTEQALRESEERFRSTLDNMLEGCQILDHDWRYVYLNDAADVHNRRPKQELLGNRYMDMWSGIEDTEVFRKIKDVLEKRTPHHIENEFVFPDGTIGWFDLSIQPVLEGVFILSVDITDRKHAEQQLQAAVQQWGTTFNTMRDGVALLDADRRIVRCNQSLCDLTGMSVEELTGQVCCEVILGREKPLPDCPVNRSAKSKQREVLEMQIGDRWLFLIADPILDENQQVVGFVHLVADTTDRMRAEEQVKYQAYLLSNVNDAVMATDENYMLTSWNRTAQNMYGWTEEEVLGKNGEDLLQPDFLDTTSEEIEKQLRTEGSILAEAIQSRKDGSKIPVEIRMNALYDESGKMNGYVSVNRDITERKQTEDEIRRYIKRIEAMLEVSQAVSSTLDLKKVLDNILSKISQIIQCDSMSVLLFQDDMMEVLACRGFEQPDQVVGLRFAIDPKLPSYDVMKKRKPVAVADIAHDYPDFQILVNQDDYKKIGSWAGIPLISKGIAIGLIALDRIKKEPFAEEELQLVNAMAGQAGLAIENARLFEEANQHLKRLTSLRDIDKAISSSFDLNLTLSILLEQVCSQLDVDAASVLLFHPTLNSLEYMAGRGFRGRGITHSKLQLGEGYAGRAALEQHMIEVPDIKTASLPFARSDLIAGEDFVSYYAVPLLAKGQTKGVLEIFHRSLLRPNQEWFDFLETLGGQTAIAVDNAELFENLQRSNLDLTFAYDKTIEGWSRAMDLRDRETEGHTLRVTDLAVRLAREMNIPKQQIVHLRRGALLHDMGKLGIPDEILHKPGKLTPQEWEIMKQHPRFAFEMLSSIDYLLPALDIPYCHHEKWDGTGYPRGLKGEQIPLAARIFAVVDVWDALHSDRPYRKAWSEEKTLAYIREQNGTHFDPQVVKAFLKILGESQAED